MTTTYRPDIDVAAALPSKNLPAVQVRDLPEPPLSFKRVIGPGLVMAGVGLATGEFIIFPYIASQVGLVFLWAAVVGVVTQFFINMEVERYTLATGETALTGFSRFGKHWGLFFGFTTFLANMWPAWATGSATLITYMFGGSVPVISVAILVAVGVILTLAPVVYLALEKIEMVKVAAVAILVLVASLAAIGATAWQDLPQGVSGIAETGGVIDELGFATILAALAFAGAGGGQNLCQSNWIRDKGFGMGAYIPRIVSPLTGKDEAVPGIGYVFEPTDENMTRWRRWWKLANTEQALTFGLITFVTITFMSLLSYATVFGRENLPDDIGFLEVEGQVLAAEVGEWFQGLFWSIGALSLFASAVGICDYVCRLNADMIKTTYLRDSSISESRIYFALVWALVALGCVVLLIVGLSAPLVLAVIAACIGGMQMFIYSALLIRLNRKALAPQLRIRSYRLAALIWAFALFGVLSVFVVIDQYKELMG
ncbi:MAG: Nramp family divalent metal transporter [Actinomycetes bacterium]